MDTHSNIDEKEYVRNLYFSHKLSESFYRYEITLSHNFYIYLLLKVNKILN